MAISSAQGHSHDILTLPDVEQHRDIQAVLKTITELARQSLGARGCSITLVDLEQRLLTQLACAGFDDEFVKFMHGRPIRLGSLQDGDSIDFALVAAGEPVERYHLDREGQGVVNPQIARALGVTAALCLPLRLKGHLIGYFNCFAARETPFTEEQRRQLDDFARQALTMIEYSERRQTLMRSTHSLNQLTARLISATRGEFLKQMAREACELLDVPVCIIWQCDPQAPLLRIVETSGAVDDEYRRLILHVDDPAFRPFLERRQPAYLEDVAAGHGYYRQHATEAQRRGWTSLLTVPMRVGDQLIGLLDVYTIAPRHFDDWERQFFLSFADYAAISLWNFHGRKRLEDLNAIVRRMTEFRDVQRLKRFVLDSALQLVNATRGSIGTLDLTTGELAFLDRDGDQRGRHTLSPGQGIVGGALKKGKPLRIADVRTRPEYVAQWPNTVSELVVPLLIDNARVRVGREEGFARKPIGILNIESTAPNAFSAEEEELLQSLAGQAAIIIDRLHDDQQKYERLHEIEQRLTAIPDQDGIFEALMSGIREVLGYDYVNISLINAERERIQTRHVIGIPPERKRRFMELADHALTGTDIQADIANSRVIEVPPLDDPRFDPAIYDEFGHRAIIRVYLPLIAPKTDRVIGTVEAGYRREFREQIYERDIHLLQGIVEYAVHLIEQKDLQRLDRLAHEFRSPIIGIRNHADRLQRRRATLRPDQIGSKLGDILIDCRRLLQLVSTLEYMLGRALPSSRADFTVVVKDVIIKAVNQHSPNARRAGFDSTRIRYRTEDTYKILIHVDQIRLGQVVDNLLDNAIKYAEREPQEFAIDISVADDPANYCIRFADRGIGISSGNEERIFEEGFRTPEAEAKHVSGSGYGLAIARTIMRELGGDLRLVRRSKPTVFEMVLPKRMQEKRQEDR